MKQIAKLYYNYNKLESKEIKKYLTNIIIVKMVNGKYYPLNKQSLKLAKQKPRNKSLTFDLFFEETNDKAVSNLIGYKRVVYLVKSSSRFFLKPDIGEILDQVDYSDLHSSKLKAICFSPDSYKCLEGTQGEHFIMTATLLTNKN